MEKIKERYTIREIAKILGISKSTVMKKLKEKNLLDKFDFKGSKYTIIGENINNILCEISSEWKEQSLLNTIKVLRANIKEYEIQADHLKSLYDRSLEYSNKVMQILTEISYNWNFFHRLKFAFFPNKTLEKWTNLIILEEDEEDDDER